MVDTPIPLATSSSYTLVAGDIGANIFCRVTATNSVASASADSNTVGPVTAATASSPFAFITSAGGPCSSNLSLTTPAIDSTGADLLIIGVGYYTGLTSYTVTDSKANTWNLLSLTSSGGQPGAVIFWCKPTTVGSGHTVNFTADAAFYGAATIAAFSGSAASPFDQQNNEGLTGSTTVGSAGSGITPSVANCLVIANLGLFDPATPTIGTSGGTYTLLANVINVVGVSGGQRMAYLIQTAATATDPEWTFGVTAANGWAANIASFKSV